MSRALPPDWSSRMVKLSGPSSGLDHGCQRSPSRFFLPSSISLRSYVLSIFDIFHLVQVRGLTFSIVRFSIDFVQVKIFVHLFYLVVPLHTLLFILSQQHWMQHLQAGNLLHWGSVDLQVFCTHWRLVPYLVRFRCKVQSWLWRAIFWSNLSLVCVSFTDFS